VLTRDIGDAPKDERLVSTHFYRPFRNRDCVWRRRLTYNNYHHNTRHRGYQLSTAKRDGKAGDVEGLEMLDCQLRNKLGKVNVLSKMRDDGSEILKI
jgi:hypothetical protein